MKPRILYINLEFDNWHDASHWGYGANFAMEEGFAANGIESFTLVARNNYSPIGTSWLDYARELVGGRKFDQVWAEIVHARFSDDFLDWLVTVAPVRVGFVVESLILTPKEWENNPSACRAREVALAKRLPYFTHLIAADEEDVERLATEKGLPIKWYAAGTVPARCIADVPPPPSVNKALFYGTLYSNDRKKWLSYPGLVDLVERPPASPELYTEFPGKFEQLQALGNQLLQIGESALPGYDSYLQSLRMIRQVCYDLWLQGLQVGIATVNLPSIGRTFTGRVLEGMAAGRPVLSWKIPGHPRTEAFFEDGKEILLYDTEEQLIEHIRRLQVDAAFGRKIAHTARLRILRDCTTEGFVAEVFAWAAGGDVVGTAGHRSLANNRNEQALFPTRDPIQSGDFGVIAQVAQSNGQMGLRQLLQAGLWREGQPLQLHLGCGEQHLEGYVNIDYPPAEHTVMEVRADLYADITSLDYPPGSVDQIRLHHVFEHFPRVTALALLIRWQQWLKLGGKLWIETPDLVGSARALLSDVPWSAKMAAVRHLAGDQAAGWAYHVDHWFPERFEHTLRAFGFDPVQTVPMTWPHSPHLANVHAQAFKARNLTQAELVQAAEMLLKESLVAETEQATYAVWCEQLRALVSGGPSMPLPELAKTRTVAPAIEAASPLPPLQVAQIPLPEVHDFNQRSRDRWVQAKATTVPEGARVLDVGAGTCPYRALFAHCDYKAHDFKKYAGIKLGNTTAYGTIDFESDITQIPVPDAAFDVILCTEVLEHVTEPIQALKEMARLVKPGGRLLLTAPLGAGLHQLPYHFYSGYTPEWYKHFAAQFGLEVVEITPNGGFFKLLAQECARVAWTFEQHRPHHGANAPFVFQLFNEWLPRYLYWLDDQCPIDQFTVGYHVELRKPTLPALERAEAQLVVALERNFRDVVSLTRLAELELQRGNAGKAHRYLSAALALEPQNARAIALRTSGKM